MLSHALIMWVRFEETPPFICWVTEFSKLICELAFGIPAFRKTLDQQYVVLFSCFFLLGAACGCSRDWA